MKKDSLGLYIKEKMIDSYEHFTNPEYGDNPDKKELYNQIKMNVISEIIEAIKEFEAEIKPHLLERNSNAD